MPAKMPAGLTDSGFRRAVREGMWHDLALCPRLDRVITELVRGAQRFLDIAPLQVALIVPCPHAGKKIRLLRASLTLELFRRPCHFMSYYVPRGASCTNVIVTCDERSRATASRPSRISGRRRDGRVRTAGPATRNGSANRDSALSLCCRSCQVQD